MRSRREGARLAWLESWMEGGPVVGGPRMAKSSRGRLTLMKSITSVFLMNIVDESIL